MSHLSVFFILYESRGKSVPTTPDLSDVNLAQSITKNLAMSNREVICFNIKNLVLGTKSELNALPTKEV